MLQGPVTRAWGHSGTRSLEVRFFFFQFYEGIDSTGKFSLIPVEQNFIIKRDTNLFK